MCARHCPCPDHDSAATQRWRRPRISRVLRYSSELPAAVPVARKRGHVRAPRKQHPIRGRHCETHQRLPADHRGHRGEVFRAGQGVAQNHRRFIARNKGGVVEPLKADQGRELQRLDIVGLDAPGLARCPLRESFGRPGKPLVEPVLEPVGYRREAQQRRWRLRPTKGRLPQHLAAFSRGEQVTPVREIASEPVQEGRIALQGSIAW